MYKISVYIPRIGRTVDMPKDKNLSLYEGVYRIELYKKVNSDLTYYLINESNGDIEWHC